MSDPLVRAAGEVDREALGRFLRAQYRQRKAAFLDKHGDWWHRGAGNRWVIEEGGEVVAYCAVIPTTMQVGGEEIDAAWWVDLVVDPAHRGRGLQAAFDREVRAAAPLIVGFPNALAAKIHRGHGWGVREDLELRMMPLRPLQIARDRAGTAGYRAVLRLAAVAAAPTGRRLCQRLETYEPRFSRMLDRWDADELAAVFANARPSAVVTTPRDAKYLRWRYLDAPYRDEIFVVGAGTGDALRVVVVIRVFERGGKTVARVLDLFGDLRDAEVVHDALMAAAKHAHSLGACQVTSMGAHPELSRRLRSAGFFVASRARFCWSASDAAVQAAIGSADLHLVLGDSDNDEP